ncbi:MAG: phosphoribosyltransferase family protein [Bacteroidota bacterium]|nr:phosphoribosyltransferase family protein [Bacteroidota bacterium]
MYHDRLEAGLALAKALRKYKNDPGVVLAVPRGGVPVAFVVAEELGFPLDILLTKKIGHPANHEYAIGAVSLTDRFIVPHNGVQEEYIDRETEKIRRRLREMYRKFMGDKDPEPLKNKTVIVIDDGIATGNTLLSTVNMLRKNEPARIIIAVPVASRNAIEKLSKEVDDIVCPLVPDVFFGVGAFYENFEQVSDEEVIFYLDKLRELRKAG